MILTGKQIIEQQGKTIHITPFSEDRVNPNSYNLRLHNELLVYDEEVLDMKHPNKYHTITIPDDGLVLQPGKLYLGRTVEHTRTTEFAPMLSGRSSTGRLGLHVHVTACFGDVGFTGHWTLELFCVEPVRVYPDMEICQIYYFPLYGDYEEYNSTKYNNNIGIQPSLIYTEHTKEVDYHD